MNNPNISDEKYIEELEKQCKEWESMYLGVRKERDQWRDRCLEAEASKVQEQRQLRHV